MAAAQAEAAVKARDWTLGMVAYDRVLAALNEVTSHHAARGAESDSGDEKERIVSPAEQAAAKAAAKAIRAARKAAKAAAKVLAVRRRVRPICSVPSAISSLLLFESITCPDGSISTSRLAPCAGQHRSRRRSGSAGRL